MTTADLDAAVVNAAPIGHPVTGEPVVAFVGRPGAKLRNLRARRAPGAEHREAENQP